jgi:hypothetical protein
LKGGSLPEEEGAQLAQGALTRQPWLPAAPAARALARSGRALSLARQRRRQSQASLTERSGIGLKPHRRLAKGGAERLDRAPRAKFDEFLLRTPSNRELRVPESNRGRDVAAREAAAYI